MTREQKLEAALREVKGQVSTWAPWLGKKIDEALATPPTSEWNEAIEACVSECHQQRINEGDDCIVFNGGIGACVDAIRALNRKEQP